MEKQTHKEELLKAVADVLDEALAEYEKLAKWEGDMQMAEDPSRPMAPKEESESQDPAEDKEEDEDKEEEKEEEGKEDDEEDERETKRHLGPDAQSEPDKKDWREYHPRHGVGGLDVGIKHRRCRRTQGQPQPHDHTA